MRKCGRTAIDEHRKLSGFEAIHQRLPFGQRSSRVKVSCINSISTKPVRQLSYVGKVHAEDESRLSVLRGCAGEIIHE